MLSQNGVIMRITATASGLSVLAILASFAAPAAAPDTTAPPRPDIHVLAHESVSGNDKLQAIIGMTDWPVGGVSRRHYHAGDEYATVLEGAIEIDNDGEPPHIYQAGQTYHNKRGIIHVAKNANNGPSKLSFVLIIDKGTDLQVFVDK